MLLRIAPAIVALSAGVFLGLRLELAGESISSGESGAAGVASLISLKRIPEATRDAASLVPLESRIRQAAGAAPPRSCVDVRTSGGFGVASVGTDQELVIASNTKLFTTAAALLTLGPDARFTTRVLATKTGSDGGTLYLVGGGDPFLGTEAFREWERSVDADRPSTSLESLVAAVQNAGIRRVDRVVGDGTVFTGPAHLPSHSSDLLAQKVIPPLGGLSVNRNITAWRGGDKQNFRFVEDPARSGAAEFSRLLDDAGIRVGAAPVSGKAPEKAVEIGSVESVPMNEVVREINDDSDNFAAEMLTRILGRQAGGDGSTQSGVAFINATLEAAGVPSEGSRLVDGSGLSRENVARCSKLTHLLVRMSGSAAFRASLAVGGESGTLEQRYTGRAKGQIAAKTGSLAEVSALAGYAVTFPGLVFAVVINQERSERVRLGVEESVVTALLTYPSLQAPPNA